MRKLLTIQIALSESITGIQKDLVFLLGINECFGRSDGKVIRALSCKPSGYGCESISHLTLWNLSPDIRLSDMCLRCIQT